MLYLQRFYVTVQIIAIPVKQLQPMQIYSYTENIDLKFKHVGTDLYYYVVHKRIISILPSSPCHLKKVVLR